ncbi:MAG: HAMP domain-containing histidine kinase [Bacteroidales bacterium]|nr:HAMP domain-containing histidine kinase [Bacteroidales bacterium]
MVFFLKNIRFVNGVYWLIKLRWLAIGWVVLASFSAGHFFGLPVQYEVFYSVCGALALENLVSLFIMYFFKKRKNEKLSKIAGWLINFQISFDFLALTILLHYSGGIENPIFFFFTFYIVISSVLLSRRNSYIQTTFALILLWLLAYLEYSGTFNHYKLWFERTAGNKLYLDKSFLIETLTIFTLTSYLLVYMASYIVGLLRKQEKAYHEANLALQQQDKIKDEYILRVTHNIKGHLAAIQMNLSIMADNSIKASEEIKTDFVCSTQARTQKLTQFVDDLLKLTQMRLNDKLETETFSLRKLVESILPTIVSSADSKSVHFRYHVDDEVNEMISNPTSIEELLVNLLGNAIRYTPENGLVELIIKKEERNIVFEICDSGIGIPKEELPNIFSEFYRASNARKFVKDGTGLGLAIVKYIAQHWGGNIKVDSSEGKGSKFTVVLPEKYKGVDKKTSLFK